MRRVQFRATLWQYAPSRQILYVGSTDFTCAFELPSSSDCLSAIESVSEWGIWLTNSGINKMGGKGRSSHKLTETNWKDRCSCDVPKQKGIIPDGNIRFTSKVTSKVHGISVAVYI